MKAPSVNSHSVNSASAWGQLQIHSSMMPFLESLPFVNNLSQILVTIFLSLRAIKYVHNGI